MSIMKKLDRILADSLAKKERIIVQVEQTQPAQTESDRQRFIDEVLNLHQEEKLKQNKIADFLEVEPHKIRQVIERYCPFNKNSKLLPAPGQIQTCNCGSNKKKPVKQEKPHSVASVIRAVVRSLSDETLKTLKPKDVLPRILEQGVNDSASVRSSVSIEIRKRKHELLGEKPVKKTTNKATLQQVQATKEWVNKIGSIEAAETALKAYRELVKIDILSI